MTVYTVAQPTITDREAYGRNQARFLEVLRRHDGRLLAADEKPVAVEGHWAHEKVVIRAFAEEDAFTRFAESPDYQISRSRSTAAGSSGVVLLARGVCGTGR